MTDKTTEALKLAEEALNSFDPYDSFECLWKQTQDIDVDKALVAIREALAEQSLGEYHGKLMREVCNKVITKTLAEPVKQEPVAWVSEDVCEGQYIDGRTRKIWWECKEGIGMAIYAAPVSVEAAVLAEREACAAICDRFAERDMHPAECAAAIRARGEK